MSLNDLPEKAHLILVAEDDPDDRLLIELAFKASGYSNCLFFVEDGEALMNFLMGRKEYTEKGPAMPMCLLLDLKMPRKDGREALKEIRLNPEYSELPILVLSTSNSEDDKQYCTELGISDYITKPDTFAGLLEMVERAKTVCSCN